MDFNHYVIEYPGMFSIAGIKPDIEIDTIFSIRSFPYERILGTSIIYDYLKDMPLGDFIKSYELEPFMVKTQSIDRTFIDKVFALCDYYLQGKTTERSRHLYDVYKLYSLISDGLTIKRLVKETREERMNSPFCESADPKNDINGILQEIADSDYYKKDYENNTSVLLYDNVDYNEAKTILWKIIDSKEF